MSQSFDLSVFTASLALCAGIFYLLLKSRASSSRLPPGPPAKPIVGNVLQLPAGGAWHQLLKWMAEYGDLVFLHGLGNKILVVNSLEGVTELLERRWRNYSDRPIFTAVGELMGVDRTVGIMPYGDEWKAHRKIHHTVIGPKAIKQWYPAQEDIGAMLALEVLERPAQFLEHVRLAAIRTVMYVGYGLSVDTTDDPFVQDNEKTMDVISQGMSPGAFLCDMIPILKYCPSWVPFQQRIAAGRKVIERTVYGPYEEIKKRVKNNTAPPSISRDLIMSGNYTTPRMYDRAAWAVANIYGAGTETTQGTLLTLVLAMALNPTVQKRAQMELDSVVGSDGLPTVADAGNLPYVLSCVKEALRWRPTTPLSLPRTTTNDDVYNGFHIPKGTMVLPNVWAISRDVPNPEQFDPDRFMSKENQPADPSDYVFGFGTRVCTGRDLAMNSLLTYLSTILWACDIKPIPGENLENHEFVPQSVSFPKPFKCLITPRSAARVQVVQHRAAEVTLGQSATVAPNPI